MLCCTADWLSGMEFKRKWTRERNVMVGCRMVLEHFGAFFFFFQAEDGIRDVAVTGVQTCALPICGFRVIYLPSPVLKNREGCRLARAVDPGLTVVEKGDRALGLRAQHLLDLFRDRKSVV